MVPQYNRMTTVPHRMLVRLMHKYAEKIDGVDLKGCAPGDLLEVSQSEGRLLLAEQWAIPERRQGQIACGDRRRADDN
jgi:hypothetical protein